MMKKDRERAILRMVYDESHFDVVRAYEKPDFILKRPSAKHLFGVEVTEFYYSGPDARMKNIPQYVSELLGGGQHLHKDDVEALKVQEVTISGPEGETKEVTNGIMRELPTTDQYARMIADAIDRKSSKEVDYRVSLSHVNLVIVDRENRLITTTTEDFYQHLFTTRMRNTLVQTSFREVFLITRLNQSRKVYVPLKMLYILSTLYLLDGAYSEYYANEGRSNHIVHVLGLFVEFMREQGATITYTETTKNDIELFWGNYGISVKNLRHISINDYADRTLPQSTYCQSKHDILGGDSSFMEFLADFMEHNTFVSDLVFDVLQDFLPN